MMIPILIKNKLVTPTDSQIRDRKRHHFSHEAEVPRGSRSMEFDRDARSLRLKELHQVVAVHVDFGEDIGRVVVDIAIIKDNAVWHHGIHGRVVRVVLKEPLKEMQIRLD